ncbi:DUF3054 domain-containing protein [Halomarina rubra]|uniref:DUF3054 domain-containing protein n=1 Tax=Halomarina rubra TaxID=2071873 RepID=A0ABD6AT70_9EURY|nr:DUF3054 domain-containing protein [Halomarina rubra]
MASSTSALRGRIDPSPATLGFVVGDLLLVGALLATGVVNHGGDPLAQVGAFLGTALPFYVGWLLTFPLAGVYALETRRSPRAAVLRVGGGWASAAIVGSALRATALFSGNAPLTFVAVMVGVGLAVLVPFHLLPFLSGAVGRRGTGESSN